MVRVEADERSVFIQSSHIPGQVEKVDGQFYWREYINQGQIIAYVLFSDLQLPQERNFLKQEKVVVQTQHNFLMLQKKSKNWKLSDIHK